MNALELRKILENKGFILEPRKREGDYRDIDSNTIRGAVKPYVFSIGGETPKLLSWLDEKWFQEKYKNLDVSCIQEFAYGDKFICNGVEYEVLSYGHWEPTNKPSAENNNSAEGLFPAWEADGFDED